MTQTITDHNVLDTMAPVDLSPEPPDGQDLDREYEPNWHLIGQGHYFIEDRIQNIEISILVRLHGTAWAQAFLSKMRAAQSAEMQRLDSSDDDAGTDDSWIDDDPDVIGHMLARLELERYREQLIEAKQKAREINKKVDALYDPSDQDLADQEAFERRVKWLETKIKEEADKIRSLSEALGEKIKVAGEMKKGVKMGLLTRLSRQTADAILSDLDPVKVGQLLAIEEAGMPRHISSVTDKLRKKVLEWRPGPAIGG